MFEVEGEQDYAGCGANPSGRQTTVTVRLDRIGRCACSAWKQRPVGTDSGALRFPGKVTAVTDGPIAVNRRQVPVGKEKLCCGAPGRDRTCNPCLRRAVLYPLSYGRSGVAFYQRAPSSQRCRPAAGRRPYNFWFGANRFSARRMPPLRVAIAQSEDSMSERTTTTKRRPARRPYQDAQAADPRGPLRVRGADRRDRAAGRST